MVHTAVDYMMIFWLGTIMAGVSLFLTLILSEAPFVYAVKNVETELEGKKVVEGEGPNPRLT
jgi:hypothetical protein